jgi:hypothetical protein
VRWLLDNNGITDVTVMSSGSTDYDWYPKDNNFKFSEVFNPEPDVSVSETIPVVIDLIKTRKVNKIVCIMSHTVIIDLVNKLKSQGEESILKEMKIELISYGSFNFRRVGTVAQLTLPGVVEHFYRFSLVESFLTIGEQNSINCNTAEGFINCLKKGNSPCLKICGPWSEMVMIDAKQTCSDCIKNLGVPFSFEELANNPSIIETDGFLFPSEICTMKTVNSLNRNLKAYLSIVASGEEPQLVFADMLVMLPLSGQFEADAVQCKLKFNDAGYTVIEQDPAGNCFVYQNIGFGPAVEYLTQLLKSGLDIY